MYVMRVYIDYINRCKNKYRSITYFDHLIVTGYIIMHHRHAICASYRWWNSFKKIQTHELRIFYVNVETMQYNFDLCFDGEVKEWRVKPFSQFHQRL